MAEMFFIVTGPEIKFLSYPIGDNVHCLEITSLNFPAATFFIGRAGTST